jgi:hypothetical protein
MTVIVKVPNSMQEADRVLLIERLTPFPPDEVAEEMERIHVERGRGAFCGCGECVEQFGDEKEVEGEANGNSAQTVN